MLEKLEKLASFLIRSVSTSAGTTETSSEEVDPNLTTNAENFTNPSLKETVRPVEDALLSKLSTATFVPNAVKDVHDETTHSVLEISADEWTLTINPHGFVSKDYEQESTRTTSSENLVSLLFKKKS